MSGHLNTKYEFEKNIADQSFMFLLKTS